jgi:hypothetical protein
MANKEVSAGAGILEGGDYHCTVPGHGDFRTSNSEEWYKHMESKGEDGKPLHMEEGTSYCIFCHKENTPFNNPWTRPGVTKGAVCDDCNEAKFGIKKPVAATETDKDKPQ